MPPETKSMGTLQVELQHLKDGQERIEEGFKGLGHRLDNVAEALVGLIRVTERVNAVDARLTIVEKTSKEREEIANRGKTYMDATRYLLPIFLGAVITFLVWITIEDKETLKRIHNLELLIYKGETK